MIFHGPGPVNVVELDDRELRNSVILHSFFFMGYPVGSLTPRSETIVFYISIDTAFWVRLFYFIK